MLITVRRGFKRLNEKKRDPEQPFSSLRRWLSRWKKFWSHSQSRNKPVARFRFGFVFNVIFCFHFVHYHSAVCMHACTFFFFFFFEERLVVHPAIHSFVAHSLYHLPVFLSNLQTGHEENEAVARYAEDRFTVRVIFSSKITFLYHPCISFVRIFNKLNNITWKSVLSATSSPLSCQGSWGWGGFFLASLLQCYLTWLG